MSRKRYTAEQIIGMLREAEVRLSRRLVRFAATLGCRSGVTITGGVFTDVLDVVLNNRAEICRDEEAGSVSGFSAIPRTCVPSSDNHSENQLPLKPV